LALRVELLFTDVPFISLRFNKTGHRFQRIFKARQVVLVAFGFIR